ncbi:MAG: hypothetical protein ACOVMI_00570 [Chitinophagaceae bacterium]|jgi:hypothetical protein
MKKQFFKGYFLLICSFTLLMFSCKKTTSVEDEVVTEEVQMQVQSEDSEMMSSETESVDDDATNTASSSARFCGLGNILGGGSLSIDTDTSNPGGGVRTITINYNGRINGCRKRTGSITVELLNAPRWIEPGATLKVTFNNFKVENVCRNKSVTLNGQRFITNVNGGNHFKLQQGLVSSLVHKVRTGATGITATFTDSLGTKTANWNAAKTTTISYTSTPRKFNYEVVGDTTINTKANTEAWGTSRFSRSYQTVINNTIKSNTFCGLWRPTAGNVSHFVGTSNVQVAFGLNAMGNPVGLGDCAGFFKVTYTNASGVSSSRVLPYR